MSGIAGILWLDGRVAVEDDARPLIGALRHRALDGTRIGCAGAVAMAIAQTITTPEAQRETQPLFDEQAAVLASLDGRLDNRDDLIESLDAPREASDVLLASLAYRRWGVDGCARLLGDFALAIWDGRLRRLLLARDVTGTRPLCYRRHGHMFAWASEPQALVRTMPLEIDEGCVAEHLAGRPTSLADTLYRNVHRLPLAHVLVADDRGASTTRRYWTPDHLREIRYRDPRDYEVQARALIDAATESRMRLCGGATLALSGGIDSCVVGAAIAALRQRGDARSARVMARTVGFAGHDGDETALAAQAARQLRLPWQAEPYQPPVVELFAGSALQTLDLPSPPNGLTSLPLRAAVRADRHRVVFTGNGGDEWFFGTEGELIDLLARGRLAAAVSWLRQARQDPNPMSATMNLQLAMWSVVPAGVKQPLRRVLGRPRVPSWINPEYAAHTSLRDRIVAPSHVRLHSHAATTMLRDFSCGPAVSQRESNERMAAYDGIEERHPLLDRRVIEFALALPNEVRVHEGLPKTVLRRAFGSVLPPAVVGMPPTLDFGWLLTDAVRACGGMEAVRRSEPVARGWIDRPSLEPLGVQLAGGASRAAATLWRILAVHFWVQSIDQAGIR